MLRRDLGGPCEALARQCIEDLLGPPQPQYAAYYATSDPVTRAAALDHQPSAILTWLLRVHTHDNEQRRALLLQQQQQAQAAAQKAKGTHNHRPSPSCTLSLSFHPSIHPSITFPCL